MQHCMHFLFCYSRWEGVWVQAVNTAGIRGALHLFAPSANLVQMFCSAGDVLHTQFLDTLSRILPHLDLIDYWLVWTRSEMRSTNSRSFTTLRSCLMHKFSCPARTSRINTTFWPLGPKQLCILPCKGMATIFCGRYRLHADFANPLQVESYGLDSCHLHFGCQKSIEWRRTNGGPAGSCLLRWTINSRTWQSIWVGNLMWM